MISKGASSYLVLVVLMLVSGMGTGLAAQDTRLIGTDICSDGHNNSTVISLMDLRPDKIYSLFRDGQYLSSRQYNPGTTRATLELGEYSEPGIYTVVEFDQSAFNQKNDPHQGRNVPGQVTISREPELLIRKQHKETQITSGSLFNYMPEADMDDVEFIWTASVTQGKVKEFEKEGRNDISLTLELADDKPAVVVFRITPIAPQNMGACAGQTAEITVWVKSSDPSYQ